MLIPVAVQVVLSLLRCNWVMTQATRIYKHSAAGTDWAALMLGAVGSLQGPALAPASSIPRF